MQKLKKFYKNKIRLFIYFSTFSQNFSAQKSLKFEKFNFKISPSKIDILLIFSLFLHWIEKKGKKRACYFASVIFLFLHSVCVCVSPSCLVCAYTAQLVWVKKKKFERNWKIERKSEKNGENWAKTGQNLASAKRAF